MVAIQALRTALFYLLFIGQTAILALIIALLGLVAGGRSPAAWALARYWCRSNIWLLRVITGLRTKVSGAENIPPGGCIIGAKHQSDWDVFAIFPFTEKPAYVVKKELMDLPFFGWAARSLDCIEIDRKRGSAAIPAMMAQARDALSRGCRIVIFPEGTRRAPMAPPDYRQGIVRMYGDLKAPVVPVALNAGLFWGRNSLIIWPGLAEARFLPPIEPGLPSDVFAERLRREIETETARLIAEADARGLSRPVDAAMRARLDALKASTNGESF
jgi:1-acyl-sn-glycerol-3-phosphate acyltransferase